MVKGTLPTKTTSSKTLQDFEVAGLPSVGWRSDGVEQVPAQGRLGFRRPDPVLGAGTEFERQRVSS